MSAFVEETGDSRHSLTEELEASRAFKEACLLSWISGCAAAQLLTSWEKGESFLVITREERTFARGDTLHHGSMSAPRANVIIGKMLIKVFVNNLLYRLNKSVGNW